MAPWALDLITDGVAPQALREGGDRAVWGALRRTALSAYCAGTTYEHWHALVLQSNRRLGQQVRYRSRGGKPRTAVEVAKELRRAWDSAQKWLQNRPDVMAAEEVARRGAERARDVLRVVEDPAADLTDPQRAVLAHAAHEVLRLQDDGKRVDLAPMPRRHVAAKTGLTERTARTALADLERRGLLVLAVQGRRGRPGAIDKEGRPVARAGLYRLPDSRTLARLLSAPASGSVGHPHQISGTPDGASHGTPDQISGTHDDLDTTSPTPQEPAVVTLTITNTISAPDAAALADAVDLLRRNGLTVEALPATEQQPRPALRVVRPQAS